MLRLNFKGFRFDFAESIVSCIQNGINCSKDLLVQLCGEDAYEGLSSLLVDYAGLSYLYYTMQVSFGAGFPNIYPHKKQVGRMKNLFKNVCRGERLTRIDLFKQIEYVNQLYLAHKVDADVPVILPELVDSIANDIYIKGYFK